MPDGTLHDRDFHAWAIDQAERLRRLSSLQSPHVEGLDFENLIEEIEDLGRSERDAVETNLRQALLHMVKAVLAPDDDSVKSRRREIRAMLRNAQSKYRNSMRGRLHVDAIWQDAMLRLSDDFEEDRRPFPVMPETSPVALDRLLKAEIDLDGLLDEIAAEIAPRSPRP